MSKKVEINLLSKEISKYLNEYVEDIDEIVQESANKIAKEATKETKEKSPVRKGKNGGSYAQGWRVKKDKIEKSRYIVKIHNKTDYQLTHLLEFGHANRDGSRTKAIPHIRPVEEKFKNLFERELESKIRRAK